MPIEIFYGKDPYPYAGKKYRIFVRNRKGVIRMLKNKKFKKASEAKEFVLSANNMAKSR